MAQPYEVALPTASLWNQREVARRSRDGGIDTPQSASLTAFHNSAWSSHTFAPPCANACAVFRPCGLRFAPCPRGSSRFAASDARRLACGTPCFTGVFVPACASLARYSGAADALWACPRPSTPSGLRRAYFGLFRALRAASVRPSPLHPFGASTGLLRAASRTARASCAPLIPRGAFWALLRHMEAHHPKDFICFSQ